MNEIALYLVLAFGMLMAALAVVLYMSRLKLVHEKQALSEKLLAAEARTLVPDAHRSGLDTAKKQKVGKGVARSQANEPSQELLELRREIARFRDEHKRLKEELRTKDNELKDADERVEGQLYVLREENKRLLELLREKDSAPGKATAAPEPAPLTENEEAKRLKAELQTLRQDGARLRARTDELERAARGEHEKLLGAQEKLSALQAELRRWKDAGSLAGKTLDPAAFVRWRQRALEGRRMYQMMRQLRDLSDQKLGFYQECVVPLARFVLTKAGASDPVLAEREVKPDKLLMAALQVVQESQPNWQSASTAPNPPTNPETTLAPAPLS